MTKPTDEALKALEWFNSYVKSTEDHINSGGGSLRKDFDEMLKVLGYIQTIRAALTPHGERGEDDCGWLCVKCEVWWAAPAWAQHQGCPKCKAKATCMGEDDSAEFLGRMDTPFDSAAPSGEPQDAEQLERDLLLCGVSFEKDGKRIDPRDVYIEPQEVDVEELKLKSFTHLNTMFFGKEFTDRDVIDATINFLTTNGYRITKTGRER